LRTLSDFATPRFFFCKYKDYNKKSLLDYLINGFTNRLKSWYDALPHVTGQSVMQNEEKNDFIPFWKKTKTNKKQHNKKK